MIQVCSYRCIASYESPLLADFSLCVLQKHNCLGLTAEIPMVRPGRILGNLVGIFLWTMTCALLGPGVLQLCRKDLVLLIALLKGMRCL